MHDFDQFERRLAAALRSDADQRLARFEPASIARTAIASGRPRSFRGRIGTALTIGRPQTGVAYLLLLLILGLALVAGVVVAGALRTRPAEPSEWVPVGVMGEARTWHTATLLPGGTVLVVGGSTGADSLPAAELYDPRTGSWVPTGSMAEPRAGHTATLLPDGQVLVAGGSASNDASASAELYDPATGSWTATGSMGEARADHTATLLLDGRVLVAGGFGVTSAEVYDPRVGTWAPTGAMIADRAYHTATLLPDGRVLVVGGFNSNRSTTSSENQATASAEIYDPGTGTWTLAATMAEPRAGHTATLLPDGRVLVAGGSTANDSLHATASVERYDPGTGSWLATGSMNVARVYAAATLLPDGSVLVAGGFSGGSNIEPTGAVAPAGLFDPTSGAWTVTNRMTEARTYPTATLLVDGTVLVTGGRTKPVLGSALASAERYGPGGGTR
jgi:N-acetylneuraminic acid mutarotase